MVFKINRFLVLKLALPKDDFYIQNSPSILNHVDYIMQIVRDEYILKLSRSNHKQK